MGKGEPRPGISKRDGWGHDAILVQHRFAVWQQTGTEASSGKGVDRSSASTIARYGRKHKHKQVRPGNIRPRTSLFIPIGSLLSSN